jgi:hypothetical protein
MSSVYMAEPKQLNGTPPALPEAGSCLSMHYGLIQGMRPRLQV